MKVTIIINNLNDGRFLAGLLESIKAQDCDYFRVVGIDAGSTDDSLAVYERFGVPVVDCTGLNQAASVNKVAADQVDTEFFSWINPDDRYLPNFLSSHIKAFTEGVGVVHSDVLVRNAAGHDRHHSPRGMKASVQDGQNYIMHPSTMIRHRCWENLGGFSESFVYAFDFEFWIRAYLTDWKFAHVKEPTAVFCPRQDSLTGTKTDAIRAEIRRVQLGYELPTDRRYQP